MTPPTTRLAALAAALALLPSCAPQVDVRAERSTIATFGRYDSYAWASQVVPARAAGETQASLIDWRIHNAVDRGLAARGYVQKTGGASLLVDYDVAIRERNTDAFGEFFEYRRRGGQLDMGEAFVAGYQEGTLVLHVVDARTGEVAYRASATAAIEGNPDGRRVDDAVARMLKDLPPAAAPTGR